MKRIFNKLNLFVLIFSLFLTSCNDNANCSKSDNGSIFLTEFIQGKNIWDVSFETEDELNIFAKNLKINNKNGSFNIFDSFIDIYVDFFDEIFYSFKGFSNPERWSADPLNITYKSFDFTKCYDNNDIHVSLSISSLPYYGNYNFTNSTLFNYKEMVNNNKKKLCEIFYDNTKIIELKLYSSKDVSLDNIYLNFDEVISNVINNITFFIL